MQQWRSAPYQLIPLQYHPRYGSPMLQRLKKAARKVMIREDLLFVKSRGNSEHYQYFVYQNTTTVSKTGHSL